MHLNCPLKFCIGIVFNFLFWEGCNSKEIVEKNMGEERGKQGVIREMIKWQYH